jgi:uncharacterized protein YbcI
MNEKQTREQFLSSISKKYFSPSSTQIYSLNYSIILIIIMNIKLSSEHCSIKTNNDNNNIVTLRFACIIVVMRQSTKAHCHWLAWRLINKLLTNGQRHNMQRIIIIIFSNNLVAVGGGFEGCNEAEAIVLVR